MTKTFDRVPPITNPTVQTIVDHHSVRHYSDRPISDDQLETILVAAQSASTSSNLNAWSAIVVKDAETKVALMNLTQGNPFIEQAPVFIVWVADMSRNVALLEGTDFSPNTLDYQETLLVGSIDTALAAQNAVIAAESMGLGVCYIGGIRTDIREVARILGLPKYVFPVVGLTLGYPSEKDPATTKPRLPLSAIAFDETYDVEEARAGADVLESAHAAYYETQGKAGVSWQSATVARTHDVSTMRGRDNNSRMIAERGFAGR